MKRSDKMVKGGRCCKNSKTQPDRITSGGQTIKTVAKLDGSQWAASPCTESGRGDHFHFTEEQVEAWGDWEQVPGCKAGS